MRYEVRQRDGKWIVWDSVNHCELLSAPSTMLKKAAVGPFRPAVANSSPRAIIEARPYMFRRRKKPKNELILAMTLTCWVAAHRDKRAKTGSLKSEIADLGSSRTLCVLNLHDSGFAVVPAMVDANSDDESNDDNGSCCFIWRSPATLQAWAKAYVAMSS